MKQKFTDLCEYIITGGVIFLVIFAPIFYGGFQVWAYSVIEFVIIFLLLIWVGKLVAGLLSKSRRARSEGTSLNPLGLVKNPLNLPICIFIGFMLFQMTPLPERMLKNISPKTYELYRDSLIEGPAAYDNGASEAPSRPAIWRPLSLYSHATRTETLKILSCMGLFLLIVNNFRKVWQINLLVIAIVALGFLEAVFGLVQYLAGESLWIFRNSGRANGTYINPNHFCGYLEMVVPLGLGLWAYQTWGVREAQGTPPRWKDPKGLLLGYSIMVTSAALIMSQSRTGIGAFLAVIIGFALYASLRGRLRKWKIISIGAWSGLATLFFIWIGLQPVIQRFQGSIFTDERPLLWADTCRLFLDFPVFGTGLATFINTFPQYQSVEKYYIYDYTHNDYLQLLAEGGTIGFLIVLTGAVLFLQKTLRDWLHSTGPLARWIGLGSLLGILALLLHSIADFNMHIPSNAMLFATLLAIAWTSVHLPHEGVAD